MKKKVSIIVCAIGAMLIAAACQSKPDTSQYPELILGQWICTYEKQVNMQGQIISENNDIGYVREFRSDGSFTDIFPNGPSITGEWTIEKDAITIHYPTTPAPSVLNGKVKKLTDKSLELDMRLTSTEISGYIDRSEKYERR